MILTNLFIACANDILFAPPPSNRLCYMSKYAFFNSLYDSGWPHSKFGAQPFENSKKPVLKVVEACNDA